MARNWKHLYCLYAPVLEGTEPSIRLRLGTLDKNIDRNWYGAWAWAVRAGYRAGHVRGWGTGDLRSQAFLSNFLRKRFMYNRYGSLMADS